MKLLKLMGWVKQSGKIDKNEIVVDVVVTAASVIVAYVAVSWSL